MEPWRNAGDRSPINLDLSKLRPDYLLFRHDGLAMMEPLPNLPGQRVIFQTKLLDAQAFVFMGFVNCLKNLPLFDMPRAFPAP